MTSHTGSARGILKKSEELSWDLPREKMVDFRLLAEALGRCRTWWGIPWQTNRKNVYLSPYVEEPLNSKVIKSFVPELRSCKCFSCFEVSMLYTYIYIYIYIYIYMSILHIAVFGYGTIVPQLPFYKDGFGIKKPIKVDIPLNKETKPYRITSCS